MLREIFLKIRNRIFFKAGSKSGGSNAPPAPLAPTPLHVYIFPMVIVHYLQLHKKYTCSYIPNNTGALLQGDYINLIFPPEWVTD